LPSDQPTPLLLLTETKSTSIKGGLSDLSRIQQSASEEKAGLNDPFQNWIKPMSIFGHYFFLIPVLIHIDGRIRRIKMEKSFMMKIRAEREPKRIQLEDLQWTIPGSFTSKLL
jgi:hypothetical protein